MRNVLDKFAAVMVWLMKRIFQFGRVLAILLFIGFFVASHTVTAFAALTSTAISSVAGVSSTVIGRMRAKTMTLDTDLRADLNFEKRRASKLVAENARLQKAGAITFRGRSTTIKAATREVLGRTATRTTRATIANVSSIPGESVPFYGIAIILAATTYEIKAACDNMNDLYDLQVAIDPDSARPDDRKAVCALQIPTGEEVWSSVKKSPQTAWNSSIATLGSVTDSVKSIEAPDFSGIWSSSINWIGDWFSPH